MSDAFRPVILIEPGTIRARDLRRIEKQAGICIVECTAPDRVRFLEPPLAAATLDVQTQAAMQLMRYVVRNTDSSNRSFNGHALMKLLVDWLIAEPRPASVPPVAEVKKAAAK